MLVNNERLRFFIGGGIESNQPRGAEYYEPASGDEFITTPTLQVTIGETISFDLIASANPATACTIFDSSASLIKVVVGTDGAMNASGGTITPAALNTSGQATYTFTATADGQVEILGADAGGLSGNCSIPYLNVNVAGVLYYIDDGWAVNPSIKSNKSHSYATDGTVVYNSATDAFFNYLSQVDPKYGDIASTTAEAQARAIEGVVKNGDFRDTDISDWAAVGSAVFEHVTDGLQVTSTVSATGARILTTVTANIPYLVTMTGAESGTTNSRIFIYDGSGTGSPLVNTFNRLNGTKSFTVTPTSTTLRIDCINTGDAGVCTYSDISARPVTVETVTSNTVLNATAENFIEANWKT